jgi:hypothetical protein
MRTTTTTKSFTIALVLATVLVTPTFAARDDGNRQTRQGQQPTIIQRIINRLKHVFDAPTLPPPTITTANDSNP